MKQTGYTESDTHHLKVYYQSKTGRRYFMGIEGKIQAKLER
jgi:hypothetical protein